MINLEKHLIQINEILHKTIEQHKKKIIDKSKFSDLTINQLMYLEAIYNLNNPKLSQLAEHIGITKASTTVAIHKLIDKELVEKHQSKNDKRVFHIYLTKSGKKLIDSELNALKQFSKSIVENLDNKDIEYLEKILKKIIKSNL